MRDLLMGLMGSRRQYATALVARTGPTGVSMFARRRGAETPLGRLDAGTRRRFIGRREATVLVLPAGTLLEQSASLPLASERDLGSVLQFEIDRFTPFRAEDLFWSWRIERRERANGLLRVRLLLVPKTAVQAPLATMQAAGLRPVALEVPTSNGVQHLSLTVPNITAGRRRSVVAGSWACAALVLLICVAPVWRQHQAMAAAEDTIEALRPRVALVDAMRRRISANATGADLFVAETARIGNPLRALAAVTASLPDDTYLTGFAMHDRKLSIAGRSGGAARLIGILSKDPELREPAFDAPVTRAGDRQDLFSIQLGLAQ